MNTKVLALKVGDRVIATTEVWDIPETKSILAASQGDLGTVEWTQSGHCPAVRFDRSGRLTDVGDSEVSLTA